jgi:hypothetical protein
MVELDEGVVAEVQLGVIHMIEDETGMIGVDSDTDANAESGVTLIGENSEDEEVRTGVEVTVVDRDALKKFSLLCFDFFAGGGTKKLMTDYNESRKLYE